MYTVCCGFLLVCETWVSNQIVFAFRVNWDFGLYMFCGFNFKCCIVLNVCMCMLISGRRVK